VDPTNQRGIKRKYTIFQIPGNKAAIQTTINMPTTTATSSTQETVKTSVHSDGQSAPTIAEDDDVLFVPTKPVAPIIIDDDDEESPSSEINQVPQNVSPSKGREVGEIATSEEFKIALTSEDLIIEKDATQTKSDVEFNNLVIDTTSESKVLETEQINKVMNVEKNATQNNSDVEFIELHTEPTSKVIVPDAAPLCKVMNVEYDGTSSDWTN
jgi:hypothetical protein